jgi:hypothetical protein
MKKRILTELIIPEMLGPKGNKKIEGHPIFDDIHALVEGFRSLSADEILEHEANSPGDPEGDSFAAFDGNQGFWLRLWDKIFMSSPELTFKEARYLATWIYKTEVELLKKDTPVTPKGQGGWILPFPMYLHHIFQIPSEFP